MNFTFQKYNLFQLFATPCFDIIGNLTKIFDSCLTAKILVNGDLTNVINILRGMKQGDALSCAIFIICIDPLLRNINADLEIKMFKFTTKITKEDIGFKAGAFSDDVGVLCGGD